MARWLTKAGSVLGPKAPEKPQPFRLTCSCGRTIEGTRSADHQVVTCRCGQRLFVLPRDVYPAVAPREKPPKRKKKKRRGKLWKVSVTRAAGSEPRPASPAAYKPKTQSSRTGRPLWTRFRAVVLAIVVAVVATAWWSWRSWSRDQARTTFQRARENGQTALREGDFATAADQLQVACRALDILGRDDALARSVRQMRRESEAASHLAARPLLPILQEAWQTLSQARSKAELQKAEALALAVYEGQWIVVETGLLPAGGKEGKPGWVVDFPLFIEEVPVILDSKLDAFETIPDAGQPRTVIFAAQLKACRLRKSPERALFLDLVDESAFLWTGYGTYRALGFSPGNERDREAVRRVLNQQSRLIGLDR